MPPFVPRKREHSPEPTPPSKKRATPKTATKKAKPSLFDAADAPSSNIKSADEAKKYLDSLGDDYEDEDDSASGSDSDEFEDVLPAKKQKTSHNSDNSDDGGDESDEDEMEWENALAGPSTSTAQPEREIADVSISIKRDGSYVEPPLSLATGKKGPSKKERQARVLTHCLHVQYLMWHNTIRNSWLNDKEVQKVLVDGLPEGVKREVTRWREAMGTLTKEELEAKKKAAAKSKKGRKGKDKSNGRDWAYDAQHMEQGVPNLSQGDPLLRLLKVLTAYWRKRFTVTAPAIRKRGYMPLRRLAQEVTAWKKNMQDAEEHGERVNDIHAFRTLAKSCEGSRDVGAQLFVALLRGIGLETRVVANLQPAGFGWSKSEDAPPKKSKKEAKAEATATQESESDAPIPKSPKTKGSGKKQQKTAKEEKPTRTSTRGKKGDPISLDDSDSPLSEPPSDDEDEARAGEEEDDDDISVIDITPSTPKKKPSKKYDRDLAFPTYWAEVCSPASHKYIPVDPIVLSTIASNDELLQTFEPRGKKAENAKQVICYVTAFSADGTAKDVTIRYLKKHQLPGKTKGMRLPSEKVPIHNRRGKVITYEDYDWFRAVMAAYERPHAKRTPADDLEEQTDLKPFKAVTEKEEVEKESLQGYKQSAEFVLEIHLRREEAIVRSAEPVRTFTAGKGDKTQDHPVFRREDVVVCKTVESWHKEGRIVKTGQQPMKHVPVRAVTIERKRQMEDVLRETGEKMTQGLYSRDQTEWIIPPPIENGVIPKNAYGNMDVYVDTMVPKGAVHLPLKGTAKICRKLQIDYAEACTGFEFGKQRAVPVITGVVVAEGNAQVVRDAWRAEQKEIKRKEDTKRTAAALYWWRKMLMGMRVVERMRAEYAHTGNAEDANPFMRKPKVEPQEDVQPSFDDGGGGGFFPEGHDEEEIPQSRPHDAAPDQDQDIGGGFMRDSDEEEETSPKGDGGFLVEDEESSLAPPKPYAPVTPISLQSLAKDEDVDDGEDEPFLEDEDMEHPEEPPKPTKRQGPRTNGKPRASAKGKGKAKATSSNDASGNKEELAPSPKVIVSRGNANRRQSARTSTKKATPVKSQYFESEDDEEEEFSEQEVIKPTRTTARTRKRA